MKEKTFDYLGIIGRGGTVTQAKRDAKGRAEQFVREAIDGPEVLQIADHVIIVYRTPYGWGYQIIGPALNSHTLANTSKDRMTRDAKNHLAKTLSTIDNVRTDIVDPRDVDDLISYFDWQRRYAVYKAQGYAPNDCHRLASATTIILQGGKLL